jgi:hypothetical protein
MRFWFTGAAMIAAAVVAACSSDGTTVGGCNMPAPGVIVQVPGIDIQVRDPFGRGQAVGTTVVVRRSDNTTFGSSVHDTLDIYSAFNVAGSFTVTLSRPYYQDATFSNIAVTPNGCVVNTVKVPVTLQLAPGAPALRSLIIIGAEFLAQPGVQAHLVPHFDADPSVSTAVTWQVSDATLATIDTNGVLTAKCSKSGGTVAVTATAVADGSTHASVTISVAPAASCP